MISREVSPITPLKYYFFNILIYFFYQNVSQEIHKGFKVWEKKFW